MLAIFEMASIPVYMTNSPGYSSIRAKVTNIPSPNSHLPPTLTTDLISKKMHMFIAVLDAAVIREKSERTNEIT